MKTHLLSALRRAVLLLAAFAFATAARAGTFSTAAWTNDATTGIASGRTLWAYHFGATTTATVNGVSVPGLAGPTASNANFDLTGMTDVAVDTNSLTALGGTGSAVVGHDFAYGGNPATITVKGLTVGRNYVVSFFSVAWQVDVGVDYRNLTFSSGSDSQLVKQDQFGSDNGIRIDYAFTATAATRVITIAVANANTATFHLHGLALQQPPFVSNTADSGTGSLRQALINAAAISGADRVTFDATLNGATIQIGSEIVINDTDGATVDATSLPGGVTISGNNATRIFYAGSGRVLGLKGLTLTRGNGVGSAFSGNGGAIMVTGGTLEAARCTFTANTTSGNGSGGAIYNFQAGNVTLDRCTLSQNAALLQRGGAIYSDLNCSTALTHCTLFGNSASLYGGGIYRVGGTVTLANSIVAGNTVGDSGPDINAFTINATGVNFIGDPDGSNLTAGATILTTAVNGPINLAPLGNYGGPTQTMTPLLGSPAIDGAVGSTATSDQRGVAIAGVPDIGAVENGSRVTTTVDQLDTPVGPSVSLREAARDCPVGGVIEFAAALAGQTVTLTSPLGGDISLGKNVTIDASSLANGMVVSGGTVGRVFHIAPGVSASFIRLTITGGLASGVFPASYGGGVYVEGALALTECSLQGNSASVGGGGFVANNGAATLTLNRSTVSGNTAGFGGGIQNEGTLIGNASTLAENTATQDGGAISAPFNKPVTLRHCTVSSNTAGTGGGVAGNVIALENSIVSGNTAPTGPDFSGGVSLTGFSILGTDALLAPLGDYGGPTKTMALRPGSLARDNAPTLPPATDQRGFPIVGVPDSGAYEAGTFTHYNAWIWETLPATATAPQHAGSVDYDGDGVTNFNEWPARTNPGDSTSYLHVTQTVVSGGNIYLTIPTVVGRQYTVEFTYSLAPADWTPYGGVLPGTGGTQTFPPIGPLGGIPQLFFRIGVGP